MTLLPDHERLSIVDGPCLTVVNIILRGIENDLGLHASITGFGLLSAGLFTDGPAPFVRELGVPIRSCTETSLKQINMHGNISKADKPVLDLLTTAHMHCKEHQHMTFPCEMTDQSSPSLSLRLTLS
jgi:hypothetical protein